MPLPKELIADHIDVIKQEELSLFRNHIRIAKQEDVPEIVADICRYLRSGKGSGELKVMFNQGGCKAIVTEQVTERNTI